MRRSELVGVLAVLVALASPAAADDAPGVQPEPDRLEVGITGLPGGDHVGYAESLPRGTVSAAFSAGFGYRSGLLASGHTMSRGAATAALAYSPTSFLSLGILLDGRYDKHSGMGFDDDGWVGEPRLHVRAGTASGAIAFGGELTLWTPGKDAPSIVPEATSVDLRALVSTRLGSGLRLAATAGFRLDNSAKSIDTLADLSTADQSSLGLSEWSAIVGGIRVAYPAGKLVFGFEAEIDAYVGGSHLDGSTAEAPRPSFLLGGSVSYELTPNLTAELFLSSNIQEKPTVSTMGTIAVIPYGPLIAGGIGLQARFGGPSRSTGGGGVGTGTTTCDDPDPARRPAGCKDDEPAPKVARLSGQITDDTGAPIAGAKVTITDCNGKTVGAVTDGGGRYGADGLAPCEVTVTADAAGRMSQSVKVTLRDGDNTAPATPLPPAVKPGRFVFIIRSFSTGKGVAAEVEINPGGTVVSTAADGSTELEIAPGTYKLKITAPGLKEQVREFVVTENNVVNVNVDLRK